MIFSCLGCERLLEKDMFRGVIFYSQKKKQMNTLKISEFY